MIPVIFDANTQDFTSNGIGRLTDCISCLVTEERNGIYEVEFTYPITGIHYDAIQQGNIILVSHDEQKDKQPFIIYHISRPINGVVTVNCHHISYLLRNIIIAPFTAVNVSDAMNSLSACSITENTFTFWTDKSSAGSMEVKVPTSCRAILGGAQGSILDSFGGGEYEFDNLTVKLYAHRGSDNGVAIRYGKNLTNIRAETDTLDLYNAVVPYWADDETIIYGGIVVGSGGIDRTGVWTDENNSHITDENNTDITFKFAVRRVVTMDLSSDFDDPPTVAELEARALTIMNSNAPWVPKENIKIDFVALWQTEEYKNVAPLERVKLCDTVTVEYPELGVNATAKVIKVVWDALLERYDSIELGEAKSSFADVIQAETEEQLADIPNISMMKQAIQEATDLITGGLGGHIVFLYDADGKPTDMLVMDTEDVATAVHVLRINVNGMGFSSSGVPGPYTSAWTLNGAFVADFITAGHLSCNRIQGGTLTLGGDGDGNGVIVVYNAFGNEIGRWNNQGLSATGDFTLQKSYEGKTFTAKLGTLTYNQYGTQTTDMGFYITDGSNRRSFNAQKDIYEWNDVTYSSSTYLGAPVRQLVVSNTSPKFVLEEFANSSYFGWTRWVDTSGSGTSYTDKSRLLFGEDALLYNVTTNFQASGPFLGVTTSRIHIKSNSSTYIYVTGHLDITGTFQVTSSAAYVNGLQVHSTSSKRYKHDITNQIDEELDAHKLYDLEMKQFVFNEDRVMQYHGMKGKTLPGFIAEDVAEIYPSATIYNADGEVESWDERRIIPGMLKLIQEQHEEIEDLKARIDKLENIVEQLMR